MNKSRTRTICVPSMELVSCHCCGDYSFEVAPRSVGNSEDPCVSSGVKFRTFRALVLSAGTSHSILHRRCRYADSGRSTGRTFGQKRTTCPQTYRLGIHSWLCPLLVLSSCVHLMRDDIGCFRTVSNGVRVMLVCDQIDCWWGDDTLRHKALVNGV